MAVTHPRLSLLTALPTTSLAMAGCGENLVKYDAVRGESTLSQPLFKPKLTGLAGEKSDIVLVMHGNGKRPRAWSVSLLVEVRCPKEAPLVLGDRPTLVLGRDPPSRSFRTDFISYIPENSAMREEHAIFDISLDDLVFTLDYGQAIQINDKVFRLDQE